MYIYILKLEGGCWYVGKTDSPHRRVGEHFDGRGSGWTKRHPPVDIHAIYPDQSDFDEDKHTLKMMDKYGVHKVRGGTFCEVTLSQQKLDMIDHLLCANSDQCHNCGSRTHFLSECPTRKETTSHADQTCYNCGKPGHRAYECASNTDQTCYNCGKPGHRSFECRTVSKTDSPPRHRDITCFDCGKSGHIGRDCPNKKCHKCGGSDHLAADCN